MFHKMIFMFHSINDNAAENFMLHRMVFMLHPIKW